MRRESVLAEFTQQSSKWPFALDYEEWLTRGSTGRENRALIDRTLAERSDWPPIFHVAEPGRSASLHLIYGAFIWQRPPTLA